MVHASAGAVSEDVTSERLAGELRIAETLPDRGELNFQKEGVSLTFAFSKQFDLRVRMRPCDRTRFVQRAFNKEAGLSLVEFVSDCPLAQRLPP